MTALPFHARKVKETRDFSEVPFKRKFCGFREGSGGAETTKIKQINPSRLAILGVGIVVRGFVGEIRASEVGILLLGEWRVREGASLSSDSGSLCLSVRTIADPPDPPGGGCAQRLSRDSSGGVAW